MLGLALNPWAWGAGALLAVGIFFGGYGCHAVKAAEEKGQLKADLSAANATLAALEKQQADLKADKAKAEAAAARIPLVVTRWAREDAAIPIGSKCEEGDAYLYASVPVLTARRQMEVFQ